MSVIEKRGILLTPFGEERIRVLRAKLTTMKTRLIEWMSDYDKKKEGQIWIAAELFNRIMDAQKLCVMIHGERYKRHVGYRDLEQRFAHLPKRLFKKPTCEKTLAVAL